MGPITAHLTSEKVDCWIDGCDFVLCQSRHYLSMSHPYKDRYHYSTHIRSEDIYGVAGNGRGGIDTRKTQLYPPKDNYGRDKHDVGLFYLSTIVPHPPWSYLVLGIIKLVLFDVSSFGGSGVYGKGGVCPRTTHIASQNMIDGLMVVILCRQGVWIINP